ncbi:MAG: 5'-deoxynucleotidase [Oscillospiraceae bacterium]
MSYSFFALISRMKNIDRWALMRNADRENVQEHSHMVAVLAHALAVIRRDVFGTPCSPEAAAAAALFHDAPEILTGDMPTPVKYHDAEMIAAYKRVESMAAKKLSEALPEAMRPEYERLLSEDIGEKDLVKAADKLSAYIKCLEELKTGNEEFRSAAQSTLKKLQEMDMPEVRYFIENFIPAFEMTLDELSI